MQLAEAIEKDVKKREETKAMANVSSSPISKPQGIVPSKRRAIAVLVPTLGQVSMWWTTVMMDLVYPMNTGKAFIPAVDLKGGEIGQMRNRLVKMALDYADKNDIDLQYIFWVDDDVIISRLALLTLAAHDRDIASGVYFCKGEAGNEPLIFSGPSSGTLKFRPDECFEAWGWSLGLSLIRTEVFRRMRDELDLGTDEYGNPKWYAQPGFGIDKDGMMTVGGTEDFVFFDNASKLGYRPLVDCTRHAFGFHYDANLKTGYPQKQWEQFVRMEPIVWNIEGKETVWR